MRDQPGNVFALRLAGGSQSRLLSRRFAVSMLHSALVPARLSLPVLPSSVLQPLAGTDCNHHSTWSEASKSGVLYPALIDMSNGKLDEDLAGLKKCEFMLQQFNLEILISTFSCGLILSFCGFINGVLARQHNQPYQPLFEMGVLTSFIAIIFHIWNIFLSKRGASLCSKHIELKPSPMDQPVKQGLECLMWSKRLFSWGIYLFSVSVSVMAVLIFDDIPFMTIFLSVYWFAAAHLFFGHYRHVSTLLGKIIFIDRTLFELMAWLEKRWGRYRA